MGSTMAIFWRNSSQRAKTGQQNTEEQANEPRREKRPDNIKGRRSGAASQEARQEN